MTCRDALNMAESQGLDLVLVAERAQPPVVKIANYGKWKYEQSKAKKENKKKTQEVKGITISPRIAEHDLTVAMKKAERFLLDNDKVRIVCRFKARELAHPIIGHQKLMWIADRVAEIGKIDRDPVLNGREMVLIINPKVTGGAKKNAKTEDEQDGGEEV